MKGRTIIVAGNGCSLTRIKPGQVLESDAIIRVNNFFFEPEYYLGRRVDLAFMGGDPRVSRFMMETLYTCQSDYELVGLSSHNAKVMRAGKHRFKQLFQPMKFRDDHIQNKVARRMAQYQRKPTTGIYAVLMAHALRAETIILTGFDFYLGEQRYPYPVGKNYCDLMGADLQHRSADIHLHSNGLDCEILTDIAARNDVKLQAADGQPVLSCIMPKAPIRAGRSVLRQNRDSPPRDWVSHSGAYPISFLKLMRKASAFLKLQHDRIAL